MNVLQKILLLTVYSFISLYSLAQNYYYFLPASNKQWQYSNDGYNGIIDSDIDLPDAWRLTTGGHTYYQDEIVIAIVDKGVNLEHPDLTDNIWKNHGEIPNNNIDDDNNGYIDDINGWNFANNNNDIGNNRYGSWHGTPINGIIGANGLNDFGVSGIYKSVKLLNLVRGSDTTSIFDCYEYIYKMRKLYNETSGKYGAFIVAVNNSWGKDSVSVVDNTFWCQLYDKLGSVGILSVVAAPNENKNLDLYDDMPSQCPSDFIISVTNSNHYDKKIEEAGFSPQYVDLSAQGEYSYTTLNNGSFGYFGGTSASAAYVTGTIGLLYSIPSEQFNIEVKEYPNKSALDVKASIINGVDILPELKDICLSGGRLNVYSSIHYLCNLYKEVQLLQVLNYNEAITTIYPTIVDNFLTLACEFEKKCTPIINIYSTKGILIKSYNYLTYPVGLHFISLNLSLLPQGIYILNAYSFNAKKSFKFVKK